MDLNSLTKKRKVNRPLPRVVLGEPNPVTPVIQTETETEQDYNQVRELLRVEIEELAYLFDSIVTIIPTTSITPPSDIVWDKPEFTLSDYLEALQDDSYIPTELIETFEEHAAYVSPEILILPYLEDTKRDLRNSFDRMSDDLFRGNFDASGSADKDLWALRRDIDNSTQLRNEVISAANIARSAIEKAVWAEIIPQQTAHEMYRKGNELVQSLEAVKRMLKVGTSVYVLDWKDTIKEIRNTLYSNLVQAYTDKLFRSYYKYRSKVFTPASSVLGLLANRAVDDVPEVVSMRNTLAKAMKHIESTANETRNDLYAIKKKRQGLKFEGIKAVKCLVYTNRLIAMLDTLIGGIRTLSGSGPLNLTVPANQGNLGKLLDNKKYYDLSTDDSTRRGMVIDEGLDYRAVYKEVNQEKAITF